MELLLGYEILESYKRLPYKVWYALAEFIDNSTQSYRDNKPGMDKIFEEEGDILTVDISYNNTKPHAFIQIKDNAFGMAEKELKRALILGKKPDNDRERSKYGLGLKTAAFWFGNVWTLETTQYGSGVKLCVTINLHEILLEEKKFYIEQQKTRPDKDPEQFKPTINIISTKCDEKEHGTVLKISDLYKTIPPTTASSCVEYLSSIYRVDIQNGVLDLVFQGKSLSWEQSDVDSKLLKDPQGDIYKRYFDFDINGKPVTGWAGILAKGGRKYGGFSLIQADRVILGFPSNYRNSLLFGNDEGGVNDLVNQRLTGEIKLDGFEVSHTKDQILFSDDEEEELNMALYTILADFKEVASKYRSKPKVKEEAFDFVNSVEYMLHELNKPDFKDIIFNQRILPDEALEQSNEEVIKRLLAREHESITAKIDDLLVTVILSEESSVNDPYLVVKTHAKQNELTIVINVAHPYWIELETKDNRFHFLNQCIYDGISEWKAQFQFGTFKPDTIKRIKDFFLRLKMELT